MSLFPSPFIACFGSDAPDEVARRLTQVEQRTIPPELRMASPELPGTPYSLELPGTPWRAPNPGAGSRLRLLALRFRRLLVGLDHFQVADLQPHAELLPLFHLFTERCDGERVGGEPPRIKPQLKPLAVVVGLHRG